MHAFLDLGRNLSRLHGRTHAPGLPARADRGTESCLAQNGDRRDSPRPRLAERRLYERALVGAESGGRDILHSRGFSSTDAEKLSLPRSNRSSAYRIREKGFWE